jgi:acyl-ACP thioesterase
MNMLTRERGEDSFLIASYESDFSGLFSIFSLFNRFQELAGIHAAHLQVGFDSLQQAKLAWVLSRIKVKILSIPRWGETVHLATWPKGVDRLFALRDFCMTDEQGKTLAVATTAWLMIDIEKGRPRRLENLQIDLNFPNAVHALEESLNKIPVPQNLTEVMEKIAVLSDIDTNQHVNNAQYAKWIADCFPPEKFRNGRMTSVQINYLEETLLGDRVGLFKTSDASSLQKYYLEGVNRAKGTKVFQALVTWE